MFSLKPRWNIYDCRQRPICRNCRKPQSQRPHLGLRFIQLLHHPCFTRLCVYMGGRWLDAKGRRDLRWETWIWGFDQRPPCETDRQSPAKATHANLQPFYRFSGRLVHPRYIRAGRRDESKWATSREVFLPSSNHPSFVIPHRGLKAHKTNKRCQLS